ncbi:class I histocompatibility antigen, Gogo-A*0501 alpha chain-like [Peromyscus californicus insignis]|uniref:class I histocompatibility antigen, Gogo-A*0501 alpha chain-like n=1 Tax=Peromyscus californicus insignis TaxID=564181 RepID=UPI0022A76EB6|nr:class I histocompatibility antigen, Gogo-A*0501 alpha chain-like [Peromyscus californicus insignis]
MASGLYLEGYFDQDEVDNNQALITGPHLLEPQFIFDVYLDDLHVERFNSRAETPRLEHCAPWVDQQEPEYWEKRTQDILSLVDIYKDALKKILYFYKENESGYYGNGKFQIFFEPKDVLMLAVNKSIWLAIGKAATYLSQEWNELDFAKQMKTLLECKCVQLLLPMLQHGKEILLRTDIPKIHVTHEVRDDGKITVRCWAVKFYHTIINVTWQRDGSNQIMDMDVIETRPAGDGSFQKWAAVVVPSGEEQRYTCHVYHEGLPEPITVRWEPPQPSVPIMPIVTGLVLGAVFIGAMVTFLKWKRRTKVGKAATYLSEEWKKSDFAKYVKKLLECKCVQLLLPMLQHGKEILLRTEPSQPSVPIMTIVTGLVLGAVLLGSVVTFLKWKRRTKAQCEQAMSSALP